MVNCPVDISTTVSVVQLEEDKEREREKREENVVEAGEERVK